MSVSQLTLGRIIDLTEELKKGGMSEEQMRSLPVFIGDDDELNGVHCAWFSQEVCSFDAEDSDLVELINENSLTFDGRAILIS